MTGNTSTGDTDRPVCDERGCKGEATHAVEAPDGWRPNGTLVPYCRDHAPDGAGKI